MACAGSAAGGVITITEGTGPAPADFPNSPNGFLLPVGTFVVNGAVGPGAGVEGGFDAADFFEFQGLKPGSTAFFSAAFNPLGIEAGILYSIFDDVGNNLVNGSFETCCALDNGGSENSVIVPADGNIVFEAFSRASSGIGEEGGVRGVERGRGYTVSLEAELGAAVPEPTTLGLTGLGLASVALGWKRRRQK